MTRIQFTFERRAGTLASEVRGEIELESPPATIEITALANCDGVRINFFEHHLEIRGEEPLVPAS